MFALFRSLCTLIGFLVLCAVGLFWARNWLVDSVLSWYVPHATTFEFHAQHVTVFPTWPLQIELKSVTIENPRDFTQRPALIAPRVKIAFSRDLWNGHAVVIDQLDLEITKFYFTQKSTGEDNFQRLAEITQAAPKTPGSIKVELAQITTLERGQLITRRYFPIESLPQFTQIILGAAYHSVR